MAMQTSRWIRAAFGRPLTSVSLLETVRKDPGMTAKYYANRYFGVENVMRVNHMLWDILKKHGQVTIERPTHDLGAPPVWSPVFAAYRLHSARRHNPDEEDLSLLRNDLSQQQQYTSPERVVTRTSGAENGTSAGTSHDAGCVLSSKCGAPSVDSTERHDTADEQTQVRVHAAVLEVVQSNPSQTIQHYVQQISQPLQRHAPNAFRHLRENGLLVREFSAEGKYIWRCA